MNGHIPHYTWFWVKSCQYLRDYTWNYWNYVNCVWTGIHDIELKWNVIPWKAQTYFWGWIFHEIEFIDPSLVIYVPIKSESDSLLASEFFLRLPFNSFLVMLSRTSLVFLFSSLIRLSKASICSTFLDNFGLAYEKTKTVIWHKNIATSTFPFKEKQRKMFYFTENVLDFISLKNKTGTVT